MISTATRPRMGTGPAIVPGWAVLVIDELWLAMPQRDVRQFALASDLEASGANLAQAGGQPLAGSGESWPVYSLDGSLQLQRATPKARSICVFFDAEGQTHGLLCDRVWSLAEDADLVVETLPGCIKGRPSPATGLAQFRNRIAMVTSRGALSAYLAHLLEQDRVECED
jgi:hypothetical protein